MRPNANATAAGSPSASNVARMFGSSKEPPGRPEAMAPTPRSCSGFPPGEIAALAPTTAADTAIASRIVRTVSGRPSSTTIWYTRKKAVHITSVFTTGNGCRAITIPGTIASRSATYGLPSGDSTAGHAPERIRLSAQATPLSTNRPSGSDSPAARRSTV